MVFRCFGFAFTAKSTLKNFQSKILIFTDALMAFPILPFFPTKYNETVAT